MIRTFTGSRERASAAASARASMPALERIGAERGHLGHLLEARARHDAEPAEQAQVVEVEHRAVVEAEARAGEARRRVRVRAAEPLAGHAEVGEEAHRRAALLERDEELLADPADLGEARPGERAREGGGRRRAEDVPRASGAASTWTSRRPRVQRAEVPRRDLDLGQLRHRPLTRACGPLERRDEEPVRPVPVREQREPRLRPPRARAPAPRRGAARCGAGREPELPLREVGHLVVLGRADRAGRVDEPPAGPDERGEAPDELALERGEAGRDPPARAASARRACGGACRGRCRARPPARRRPSRRGRASCASASGPGRDRRGRAGCGRRRGARGGAPRRAAPRRSRARGATPCCASPPRARAPCRPRRRRRPPPSSPGARRRRAR